MFEDFSDSYAGLYEKVKIARAQIAQLQAERDAYRSALEKVAESRSVNWNAPYLAKLVKQALKNNRDSVQ